MPRTVADQLRPDVVPCRECIASAGSGGYVGGQRAAPPEPFRTMLGVAFTADREHHNQSRFAFQSSLAV